MCQRFREGQIQVLGDVGQGVMGQGGLQPTQVPH